MKKTFLKLSLSLSLAFSLFSPLVAQAQTGGPGCIRTDRTEILITKVVCSQKADCSDVRSQCDPGSSCGPRTQCAPLPTGPAPSKPTSTFNPAFLPIQTGLPIPNALPISGAGGQGPVALVANFYSFAFVIAGFLAFGMIVYGGFRYTFSAGSHSSKEEAKDAITQALLGLGLLLVAYLILRTINPDLTRLQLPTLEKYNPPPPPPSSAIIPHLSTICSSGPCVTIAGHLISPRSGNKADYKMALVLSCMAAKGASVRITEAMPATVPHLSACHNNGCCVDMTLVSESKTDCAAIEKIMAAAWDCKATKVLNEYAARFGSPCKGTDTEKATGPHLHVAAC